MKVTIKDGPNKDRQFYSCQSRACNFFEWVNTNAAINTSSNSDSNNYKKNETFSAPQAVPEKKGNILIILPMKLTSLLIATTFRLYLL